MKNLNSKLLLILAKYNLIDIIEDKNKEQSIVVKPIDKNNTITDNLTTHHLNIKNTISELKTEELSTREQLIEIKEKQLELKIIKHELVNHPIFKEINNLEKLRVFMQWHVFAVWDFMSLIKRLQQDLTCTTLPWMPNKFIDAARLVNEIVLGEETDTLEDKSGHISHFNLYIAAMKEVNSDTTLIEQFIRDLQNNRTLEDALNNVPQSVKEFVLFTIDTAKNGSTYQVAGSFFYGRENIIPDMFSEILKNCDHNHLNAPMFTYYLKRHIELDSGEHGPAAERIISVITESDHEKTIQVLDYAIKSIAMRIKLWDGILKIIKKEN